MHRVRDLDVGGVREARCGGLRLVGGGDDVEVAVQHQHGHARVGRAGHDRRVVAAAVPATPGRRRGPRSSASSTPRVVNGANVSARQRGARRLPLLAAHGERGVDVPRLRVVVAGDGEVEALGVVADVAADARRDRPGVSATSRPSGRRSPAIHARAAPIRSRHDDGHVAGADHGVDDASARRPARAAARRRRPAPTRCAGSRARRRAARPARRPDRCRSPCRPGCAGRAAAARGGTAGPYSGYSGSRPSTG